VAGLAIVGASQSGIPWTEWLIASLDKYDYPGPIRLVNPKYAELLGRPCYPSVEALPEPPDVGVVQVGARHVVPICRTLVDRGCRDVVVISNGFRESGTDEGRRREEELQELCAGRDVVLVGPNCVGFASFHDGICAISQPVPRGIVPGSVSVISQSGGLTAAAMGAVLREGLGLDLCYSIGNGAAFGLPRAVRTALARDTTRVVCAVVESIEDRAGVEQAAREAADAGKALVFLTLGQSEGGKGIARSHTGAVVSEQRLLAAWLRELGVVVVDSADELGRVATLFEKLGRPDPARGTFVATVSGGGAGLTADLATRHGVRLSPLEPATEERLRELLPDGAYVGNPLDVQTGDSVAVYTAVAADPSVEVLVEPWMLPWPDDELHWQRDALERIASIAGAHGVTLVVGSLFEQPLNDWARAFGERPGVCVTPGLELTMAALGKLYGHVPGTLAPSRAAAAAASSNGGGGLIAEAEARTILDAAGLPVVQGAVGRDADEVVRLAAPLRPPWVVKLSASSVAHKERVNGVRLGLGSEEALRRACEEIAESALAAGVPREEIAFLVTEMAFGPEILVGALRDPVAGPSLTVALGGWAAEAGALFGTVPLPADEAALAELARGWGLAHLLGARRADQLVRFLAMLGEAFADGGLGRYATIEVNPLILTEHGASVVDALIVPANA
jgi:acyl-CoA synthetase (NDP forming)